MPHACCVPNCRSNYDKKGPNISVFSFPNNEEQKLTWLRAIPRQDFTPTKYSKVCILHFREEDVEKSVKFTTNTGDVLETPLSHPRLRKNAVPSNFPGCPDYFSKKEVLRESPVSKRRRLENDLLRQAVEDSLETSSTYTRMQAVQTLQDISDKFNAKLLPPWTIFKSDNFVSLLKIEEIPNPSVNYIITIDTKMQARVYFKNTELNSVSTNTEKIKLPVTVETCNFLETLIAGVDNIAKIYEDRIKSLKIKVDLVQDIFDSLINLLPDRALSIKFLKEQVSLLEYHSNRKAIRYSYETLLFCSLFLAISPHAYKFVRNYEILILPCTATVKKICNNSLTDPRIEQSDEGFLQYIKLKAPLLSEKDKLVNLMTDEVHLKPYIDVKAGNIVGSAINSVERATSACTFMISSITSTYKDVVHVAPVKKLTGDELHKFQKKIICGLEKLSFEVVVATTDNHRVNRNAISLFSQPPTLTNEYVHPNDNERPLFYTVDTVHLLKNIRNNLISKEPNEFLYPDFEDFGMQRTVSFDTIREMHRTEENQLLKYGYTVSKKALYPTSIEKQNVKLVLQVFNRTTVVALRELGPKIPLENYEGTAMFLEIICTWWDIVNVKSYFKGIRYRNKFQEPLKKDAAHIFEFMNKFILWLDEWDKLSSRKLTKDTHIALRLSTEAILKIAMYCFEKKHLTYILPGKIQNDNIEDRFGKYRMLAGSQYLISVRQLYEVEKKLRLMSLVPLILKSQSGGVTISKEDISSFLSYGGKNDDTEFIVNPSLKNETEVDECDLEQISENIWPSLVYVAGYASYSLLKLINCDYCREFLVNSRENLSSEDASYPTSIISASDRGGLCYPKDDVVICAAYAYLTMEKILLKERLFLNEQNHRAIVTTLTFENIKGSDLFLFLGHNCNKHQTIFLIKQILFKFANLLLKNFAKKKNDVVTTKKPFMPELKRIKGGKKAN